MFNPIGCGRGIGGALRHAMPGESFIRHIGSDKLIFDFKEGSGTTVRDKSHCGNDGTLGAGAAAPTWMRNSLYSENDDYILVADNTGLRFGTGDFSIVIQVIDLAPPDDLNYDAFIAKGQTVENEFTFYHSEIVAGTVALRFYSSASFNLTKTLSTLTDGSWHNCITTRKSGIGNLYYEGEFVVTDTTATDDISTTKDISIGASEEGTDRFFIGYIRSVRILNKGLSGIKCQQEYLANKFKGNN